jgi:hypothetical protein
MNVSNSFSWIEEFLVFLCIFLLVCPSKVQAQGGRLFTTTDLLPKIQEQILVAGSHHHRAFQALKWRVDQNDLSVYGEDVNRYNRSYLAQELAFVSLFDQSEKEKKHYAKEAYNAIKSFYEHPEQQRFPHKDYGLSRAMMQLGLALPYNWCKEYWEDEETIYVEERINEALDAWLTYEHANFRYERASNWVAVCRGGELVLLLASGQKEARKERYDFLIEQLSKHMQNGYGDHGASQEGMGYLEYGGTFLLKAIFAAASLGDSTLYHQTQNHAWWKLTMYAESFQDHKRKFLMTGVAGSGGIDEGWSSLLFNAVPTDKLPYYLWFYDRHMGRLAPGSDQEKFDSQRAGTIWSILYYPIQVSAKDPTGIFPAGIHDDHGYFFFRNRWKDENDILFSVMADEHHHSHAWDQPEVFALNLMAHDTRYIGGPSKERDNQLYSSLLVDSTYNFKGASKLTGELLDSEIASDYASVRIGGGELYQKLGLTSAERMMALQFDEQNTAVICLLDRVEAISDHLLTWQINIGDQVGKSDIDVLLGDGKFKLKSSNGMVEAWILDPEGAKLDQLDDPVQVMFSSADKKLMMLLYIYDGTSDIQAPEKLGEDGKYSFLGYNIWFDQSAEKLSIKN